jgi:protein-tyrosine phosphatase
MKIMNIFDKSINKNNGKISVHCHAGRGRTLMAIGAWLIYFDRMSA